MHLAHCDSAGAHRELKDAQIIRDTSRLYALSMLKADLAWLLCRHIVDSTTEAQTIWHAWDEAVRSFDEHAQMWVEAFMIPDELIHAPIARDWIEYNKHDNCGEVWTKSKY
jgi:acyl-CoA oxidase